eukprot:Nk52_evm4s2622 gene=Nk52_evmTU4s2622
MNSPIQGGTPSSKTDLTVPGVLNFLQTEWSCFERERGRWEVERAQLKSKIVSLEGEKTTMSNLQKDLVRRIRMLELALKREREQSRRGGEGEGKGEEVSGKGTYVLSKREDVGEAKEREGDEGEEEINNGEKKEGKSGVGANSGVVKKKKQNQQSLVEEGDAKATLRMLKGRTTASRQILRHYLSEIGFTESVLKAKMKGLTCENEMANDMSDNGGSVNDSLLFSSVNNEYFDRNQSQNKKKSKKKKKTKEGEEPEEKKEGGEKRGDEWSCNGNGNNDSVDATRFDSAQLTKVMLKSAAASGFGTANNDSNNQNHKKKKNKKKESEDGSSSDAEARHIEEDIGELASLSTSGVRNRGDKTSGGGEGVGKDINNIGDSNNKSRNHSFGALGGVEAADLDNCKKWKPRYTLRSHYDAVQDLCFHEEQPILATASEDCTVKLWHLWHLPASSGTSTVNSPDIEPAWTYRGHSKPCLCVAMSCEDDLVFSGSADATVRSWHMPRDQSRIAEMMYGPYEPEKIRHNLFIGHADAVWSIAKRPESSHVLTTSADGTCKLWDYNSNSPLKNNYCLGSPESAIESMGTCVSFMGADNSKFVCGISTGTAALFDVETGQRISEFTASHNGDNNGCGLGPDFQVNAVACHPTLPLVITGNEDKTLRFYDTGAGKCIETMNAHLDSVTSLSIDPSELYLMSSGHDCSLRIWDVGSRTCVNEMTCHRKKLSAGIQTCKYHPRKPYMASGGADACVKVFL